MVVKCISSFRHQVIAGKIYLVVEILVKRYNAKISYRIIDEEGFWGEFIEDNTEANDLLRTVVNRLALLENITLPNAVM